MPSFSVEVLDTSMSSPAGLGRCAGVFGVVVMARGGAGWVGVGVGVPWTGGALAGVGEAKYSNVGTAARRGIVWGLPKAGGKKRAPFGGGAGQGVLGGEVGALHLLLLLLDVSMLFGWVHGPLRGSAFYMFCSLWPYGQGFGAGSGFLSLLLGLRVGMA